MTLQRFHAGSTSGNRTDNFSLVQCVWCRILHCSSPCLAQMEDAWTYSTVLNLKTHLQLDILLTWEYYMGWHAHWNKQKRKIRRIRHCLKYNFHCPEQEAFNDVSGFSDLTSITVSCLCLLLVTHHVSLNLTWYMKAKSKLLSKVIKNTYKIAKIAS